MDRGVKRKEVVLHLALVNYNVVVSEGISRNRFWRTEEGRNILLNGSKVEIKKVFLYPPLLNEVSNKIVGSGILWTIVSNGGTIFVPFLLDRIVQIFVSLLVLPSIVEDDEVLVTVFEIVEEVRFSINAVQKNGIGIGLCNTVAVVVVQVVDFIWNV